MEQPPKKEMKSFTPDDYIVGVWFVPGKMKDWMCVVWKEGTGWAGHYRFRYHMIDDPVIDTPWSGLDEKSWYAFSTNEMSEQEVVESITLLAEQVIAKMYKSTAQFVSVHGNSEDLINALKAQPWAHMQQAPISEE